MAPRFRSFTHRGIVLGVLLCGLAARQASAAGPPRFKAVAFDYFVIFDPNSVVPEIDAAFPGRGKEFANLWRTRQFEYAWLRSMTNRYVDYSCPNRDGRFTGLARSPPVARPIVLGKTQVGFVK